MCRYTLEQRTEFFRLAYDALVDLQEQEDKPYLVRSIAEAMKLKYTELANEPTEFLTKRLGATMVARARDPESNLKKTRNPISNDLGGNYFYYATKS